MLCLSAAVCPWNRSLCDGFTGVGERSQREISLWVFVRRIGMRMPRVTERCDVHELHLSFYVEANAVF